MQTWNFVLRSILLLMIMAVVATPTAIADDWIAPLLGKDSLPTCKNHISVEHDSEILQQEQYAFQVLAEEALALRAITIKVGREFKRKADADLPLTGYDLDLLGKGLANHLALREKLLKFAKMHECWLDIDQEDLRAKGVTSRVQLEGVMISLASALVLYDNYLYTATLFEADPKLRYILNEGDRGYQVNKAELMRVTLSYNSIANRARVRMAMRYYEKTIATGSYEDLANSYLAILIEQSPSYDMVRSWSPFRVIARKLGTLGNLTVDSLKGLERDGVSLFSMLFGNTVGLVETRKGKLYQRKEVQTDILGELRSGDILLEKTPFRLTDKLIPGYWGHAAVWIGTEAELRKLEIWDHPLVAKYAAEIRAGRLVVEALRSGVEMNSLEHFLNIDSFGVLRRPDLTTGQRAQIVLNSLRQVGKSYDFNFDVESIDTVYCSKLVYLAYHGVDWPVQESFGRKTISPDDVAVRLFNKDDLQLISFYHDGASVDDQPISTMAALMDIELAVIDRPEPRPGL